MKLKFQPALCPLPAGPETDGGRGSQRLYFSRTVRASVLTSLCHPNSNPPFLFFFIFTRLHLLMFWPFAGHTHTHTLTDSLRQRNRCTQGNTGTLRACLSFNVCPPRPFHFFPPRNIPNIASAKGGVRPAAPISTAQGPRRRTQCVGKVSVPVPVWQARRQGRQAGSDPPRPRVLIADHCSSPLALADTVASVVSKTPRSPPSPPKTRERDGQESAAALIRRNGWSCRDTGPVRLHLLVLGFQRRRRGSWFMASRFTGKDRRGGGARRRGDATRPRRLQLPRRPVVPSHTYMDPPSLVGEGSELFRRRASPGGEGGQSQERRVRSGRPRREARDAGVLSASRVPPPRGLIPRMQRDRLCCSPCHHMPVDDEGRRGETARLTSRRGRLLSPPLRRVQSVRTASHHIPLCSLPRGSSAIASAQLLVPTPGRPTQGWKGIRMSVCPALVDIRAQAHRLLWRNAPHHRSQYWG